MNNKVKCAAALAAFLLPLFAARGEADFGVSGWEIFRKVHPVQFNSIGLTAPVHGDLSAMLYNPAALGTHRFREVQLISEQGLAEDRFYSILYGQPLKNGMVAAGAAYYDAGQAELNWMENGILNTSNVTAQKDMMAVVSFQHQALSRLSWGVSLKGASSELAQSRTAYAYAVDLGALYFPSRDLAVSLAAQNLGIATRFVNKEELLPAGAFGGLGYHLRFGSAYLLSSVGVTYLVNDQVSVPEAGIELGAKYISFNVGYRSYTGVSNLHLGLRLVFKALEFGYAFLPSEHLDSRHRFSIGYRFGPAS